MNNSKPCYQELEYNSNNGNVWYTHYRGYIVKSYLEHNTNRIIEEKIPYGQPSNFLNFLDNYFKYKLKYLIRKRSLLVIRFYYE